MILVTGGAGYIGSHTLVELLEAGFDVVACDNLINSKKESIARVEKITKKKVPFYKIDVADSKALDKVFSLHPKIDSVIHFAGLKAVGESVEKPLLYYKNNLYSTISLLEVMKKRGVKNLVFSSSATVYGMPDRCPIDENAPTSALNPYGNTKKIIEEILIDISKTDKSLNIALLRYFNPVGAHASGLIGEDPQGIPNNLMPFITKVATGSLEKLSVFGTDYPTPDGSAIRDYIHVVDLAKGHLAALNKLKQSPGLVVYNLGTGNGSSVLEVLDAFEKATKVTINKVMAPRRAGDAAICYSSSKKAEKELGWTAKLSLSEMCLSHYLWQVRNPRGYE